MRIIGFILLFLSIVFANDTQYIANILKEMQNFKIEFKPLNNPLNAFFSKKIKINKTIKIIPIPRSDKKLHLEAIVFNRALINNIWVKKGDEIYGYKVVDIKSKEVVLLKNGKKFILKMKINLLKVKR
jgi:hypothetical protein